MKQHAQKADSSFSSLSSLSSMSTTSSKEAHASYASHINLAAKTILPDETKIVEVDKMWTLLGYNSSDFPNVEHHVRDTEIDTMNAVQGKVFSGCLNQLSAHVRAKLGLDISDEIQFFDTPTTVPKDHPTGSACCPDIIATTQRGEIHWTGIEATVKIHSSGQTVESACGQAASYSTSLLQARPDLLAVQGFCVTAGGVALTVAGSSGVRRTEELDMAVCSSRVLLYAFIHRLYKPDPEMVDRSINRRWDATATDPHYVFDITLRPEHEEAVLCAGYRTIYAPEFSSRRAHIFVNKNNPAAFNGVRIPVIKDAYCELNNRFTEDDVIRRVHSGGDVPGVVHVAYAEGVCYAGTHRVIVRDGRQKTRLCLTAYGLPFMDLKTPKEVLIAIYDLLESTRVMHRNCDVLHRDISVGNLMFRELDLPLPFVNETVSAFEASLRSPTLPTSESHADTQIEATKEKLQLPAVFCGARYMLGETADRACTKNLLIDLERAEILDQKGDLPRLPTTGTVRYMARSIRETHPLGDIHIPAVFSRMPALSKAIEEAYKTALPDRVDRFACKTDCHIAMINTDPSTIPARHALRHDAESAFWILVWWAVCAAPESTGGTVPPVPTVVWDILTDHLDHDYRPLRLPGGILAPAYAPLLQLLHTLGEILSSDLYWATETPYNHPEFLHEMFQREILGFLVDHEAETFMGTVKSRESRQREVPVVYAGPVYSNLEGLRYSGMRGGYNPRKRSASFSSLGELERVPKRPKRAS